jgi:choline-sulfatase
MSRRPNVLFLMTDEHRADVIGYEGNRVVRTPTLDRLASSGVVFSNAYTPSPICVPARQCMMAGQLPKTCDCEGWIDLKPGYMTFARRFAQYAYKTVACGKLHHEGLDKMQGWTNRIGSEMYIAPQYIEDKVEDEFAQCSRPFKDYKWSDSKEIKRAGIGRGPYVAADEYTIQGALNFIDDFFLDPYYDREKFNHEPLMLKVSLLQPHYPYIADPDKFRYYLNRVEPFPDETVSEHPFLSRRRVEIGKDVSEREVRRAVAAYYAMVETADEHFGTVLDALENAGQNLDDWIIVYTSDHGEMLGEHGIWEKQKFYEGSVRVPLIISCPSRFTGRTVTENVNLCDLFATLCELADIPVPSGLDSRSLVPLLRGENCCWNNETVSQFGKNNVMIKQDHLKYQYYGPNMPEVLFDLQADPSETIDFIDHPSYENEVAKFRKRLAELGHGKCGY